MSEWRELLPDYALGLLEGEEKVRLERELEASPELRSELDSLRHTLTRLPEALPPVAPPPGAWAGVQRRVRPRRPWFALAAAAAVLVMLLAGGLGFNQYRALQAEQTKIAQWLAIPEGKWRVIRGNGEVHGTMIWVDGRCLMVMEHPAPRGRVYQAWGRVPDGEPVSLGVFRGRVFETRYEGFESVGVSLEPPGGSPAPTQPLGRVSLAYRRE